MTKEVVDPKPRHRLVENCRRKLFWIPHSTWLSNGEQEQ